MPRPAVPGNMHAQLQNGREQCGQQVWPGRRRVGTAGAGSRRGLSGPVQERAGVVSLRPLRVCSVAAGPSGVCGGPVGPTKPDPAATAGASALESSAPRRDSHDIRQGRCWQERIGHSSRRHRKERMLRRVLGRSLRGRGRHVFLPRRLPCPLCNEKCKLSRLELRLRRAGSPASPGHTLLCRLRVHDTRTCAHMHTSKCDYTKTRWCLFKASPPTPSWLATPWSRVCGRRNLGPRHDGAAHWPGPAEAPLGLAPAVVYHDDACIADWGVVTSTGDQRRQCWDERTTEFDT